MSKVLGNTPTATYSWYEAIERIFECDDMQELQVLCEVLTEEKKKYALVFLELICAAAARKRQMLLKK